MKGMEWCRQESEPLWMNMGCAWNDSGREMEGHEVERREEGAMVKWSNQDLDGLGCLMG